VHSTVEDTSRGEAVHLDVVKQRLRRIGKSSNSAYAYPGGIPAARSTTPALHRLICTPFNRTVVVRYPKKASLDAHTNMDERI
jgi:hypothetical protein